jgi:uncharacterized YigZ family protein
MSNLSTLLAPAEARQEIKKSRFVAHAGLVADGAEAKAFILAHSDATAGHNCWAWRLGQNYRFNDDGEPGGTAGKPILQAIEGQGIDRVAIVVSRWFGGILLGSGGLMRAYGGTAAICLRGTEKVPLIETIAGLVDCSFGDLALVQSRLAALAGVQIGAPAFHDRGATLSLAIPKADLETAARLVTDLTSGRACLKFPD